MLRTTSKFKKKTFSNLRLIIKLRNFEEISKFLKSIEKEG